MRTSLKLISLIVVGALIACQNQHSPSIIETPPLEPQIKRTSSAGKAIDMWSHERAYPESSVQISLLASFEKETAKKKSSSRSQAGEWESLGPENIGGRTLCLAFHPTDADIMFAGSASGGLWKTNSQGIGRNAWQIVPTGFPVLGVASIAIDPTTPDVMYIGTGEVYGSGGAEPGTVVRTTRGTYGIGILKSIDGGDTWDQVLNFDQDQLKGVQDIQIDINNSLVVFAATSDGVYRSTDGGDSWSLVFNRPHCFDIEMDPNNSQVIYVSQGNFNSSLVANLTGIYKSTNGGNSFAKLLDSGLISAWSGNAKLALDPNNPNVIYASIQVGWFNTGPTTPGGIYKSTNAGSNWTQINDQNIAQFQGWYSHDIAVNPNNSSEVLNVGIAAWKSTDAGLQFSQQSKNSWTFHPTDAGIPVEVSVNRPEGAEDYVHSDIHQVYYHPINNKVFYATDGGVFVSDDGAPPFTTLNGGLQTSQIYADMASSATDPNFCIIGMQDNSSYVYRGTPSWSRFIGGDGMTAKINQENDNIAYASWQGLNVVKLLDLGLDTSYVALSPANFVQGDFQAFSAPFELAPSDQSIIYAGTRYLYRSNDDGDTWQPTSTFPIDGLSNVVLKIAISPDDPNVVFIATTTDPRTRENAPKIMKTIDGGRSFATIMNGLPDRIAKDLAFNPSDPKEVFVVYSGFGTDHVFHSLNAGENWSALGTADLPDVPTNTIFIDPLFPDDIYIGNDLGVYFSEDHGLSWAPLNEGLTDIVMVYDLNYSPSNRKLRIASHGRGVFERDLVHSEEVTATKNGANAIAEISVYPNPASDIINIKLHLTPYEMATKIEILDVAGRQLGEINSDLISLQENTIKWPIPPTFASGIYFIKVSNTNGIATQQVNIL